jgi:hypothetical protein
MINLYKTKLFVSKQPVQYTNLRRCSKKTLFRYSFFYLKKSLAISKQFYIHFSYSANYWWFHWKSPTLYKSIYSQAETFNDWMSYSPKSISKNPYSLKIIGLLPNFKTSTFLYRTTLSSAKWKLFRSFCSKVKKVSHNSQVAASLQRNSF